MPAAARHTCFAATLGLIAAWTAFADTAQAQIGNWEYSADLGGWPDVNRGLVWGQDLVSLHNSSYTWDGAVKRIQLDAIASGFLPCRLSTVEELLDVSATGGYDNVGYHNVP